jgi:hypothetical protein
MTEANAALLVANYDERSETKTTATLNNFGDAINVNELVNEFAVALLTTAIFAVTFFLCHILFLYFFPEAQNY